MKNRNRNRNRNQKQPSILHNFCNIEEYNSAFVFFLFVVSQIMGISSLEHILVKSLTEYTVIGRRGFSRLSNFQKLCLLFSIYSECSLNVSFDCISTGKQIE